MTTPSKHRLLGAALLAAAAAIGVQAQTVTPAPAATPATAAPTLTMQQVIERLAARGYRDISEIELERDGSYEVEARDGQGRKVELKVDGRTGELLAQDIKVRH
ncbi:PepSY domain-containing protein [Azohydromonas australica]|uniref:PepSY domain-containing protein n=1 Tax=Azohydromonas australica TaxID=364039 RepID=UPI0004053951|nr:PepSY domain-containing protein [Azohydromonas australica]